MSTLVELLDLTISDDKLKYPYNEDDITQRNHFRSVFLALADRQPIIKIEIIYASRSEISGPAPTSWQEAARRPTRHYKARFKRYLVMWISRSYLPEPPDLLTLSRRGLDFQIRLPLAEASI
jgi:hypothetical protein